jgi:hypothetical protein
LSSFENFGGGVCGFQQQPWMANIDGVGVWSQSGEKSQGLAGFDMGNTHQPWISQKGSVLTALYLTPSALKSSLASCIFSYHVRMFWPPNCCFDEEIWQVKDHKYVSISEISADDVLLSFESSQSMASPPESVHSKDSSEEVENKSSSNYLSDTVIDEIFSSPPVSGNNEAIEACRWWIGRRNNVYIGVYCTQPTTVESADTEGSCYQETDSSPTLTYRRRLCKSIYNSWVCVVGVVSDYPTIKDFARRCLRISITDHYQPKPSMLSFSKKKEKYKVLVSDHSDKLQISIEAHGI